MHLHPPISPLFPYTTLFRSLSAPSALAFPTDTGSAVHHPPSHHSGRLHRGWWTPPHPANRCSNPQDRKSTRLNSSHVAISYAVFCLKKKNNSKLFTQSISMS